MTLYCLKTECAFKKKRCFTSVVFLIFLPKTLIWNKTTFTASNLMNLLELVVSELMKSISKKPTNILFPI